MKIEIFVIGMLFTISACLSSEEQQRRTYRLRLKNCELMDSLARLNQLDTLCACRLQYGAKYNYKKCDSLLNLLSVTDGMDTSAIVPIIIR